MRGSHTKISRECPGRERTADKGPEMGTVWGVWAKVRLCKAL